MFSKRPDSNCRDSDEDNVDDGGDDEDDLICLE